jgi:hypothetical protein
MTIYLVYFALNKNLIKKRKNYRGLCLCVKSIKNKSRYFTRNNGFNVLNYHEK